tara:strand:+ start:119 stop:526 length:408 start_codon:yes stop_codon:yes gene_type:complete
MTKTTTVLIFLLTCVNSWGQEPEQRVCVVADFHKLAAIGESEDLKLCKKGDILFFERVYTTKEALSAARRIGTWLHGNNLALARVCEVSSIIASTQFAVQGNVTLGMCIYSGKILDVVNAARIIKPGKEKTFLKD